MEITPEGYAISVVRVLSRYFSDLHDPATARLVTDTIEHQARHPEASFEIIVDDPGSARFRLKSASWDRRRVRLAYFPVLPPGSVAGNTLESTVNNALRALEADHVRE